MAAPTRARRDPLPPDPEPRGADPTAIRNAKPEFTLSAGEYQAEWTGDAEAARKKYRGKIIDLSGMVASLAGSDGVGRVVLVDEATTKPVACEMLSPEPWGKYFPGQRIKVRGTADDGALAGAVVIDPGTSTGCVRSAERLAQEFADDAVAYSYRYRFMNLVVEGTIVTLDRGNEFSQERDPRQQVWRQGRVCLRTRSKPRRCQDGSRTEGAALCQGPERLQEERDSPDVVLSDHGGRHLAGGARSARAAKLADAELEEQIQQAGAGLKLVPLDMTLNGVDFTMQMPEARKADSGNIRIGDARIEFEPGRRSLRRRLAEHDREDELRVRTVLGQTSDVLVHGALQEEKIDFDFVQNLTLGHLDVHVVSRTDITTLAETLRLLHCIRTAKVKPGYKPPQTLADLDKIGIGVIDDNPKKEKLGFFCLGTITDSTIPILVKLMPDMQMLVLRDGLTDSGLKPLGKLKKLRRLVLWGNEIDGPGLIYLRKLTQMEELEIRGSGIDDSVLIHLKPMTRLKELHLSNNRITGTGLVNLAGATQLTSLALDETPLTDEGLKCLPPLPALESLSLGRARVNDEGLAAVAPLAQLKSIVLSDTKISDEGLKQLAPLKQLETIDLRRTRTGDGGLRVFAKLPALETLWLGETDITGNGLAQISGLKKLRTLQVSETKVGDEALPHLKKMPALGLVFVDKTELTDKALEELKKAKPELTISK